MFCFGNAIKLNDLPSHWILFITVRQRNSSRESEINLKPKVVTFITKNLNLVFF